MDPTLYTELLRTCCYNCFRPRQAEEVAPVLDLNRAPPEMHDQLKAIISQGTHPAAIVEQALRRFSGSETNGKLCPDGALSTLKPLLDERVFLTLARGMHKGTAIVGYMAKGYSIAACAYHKKYTASPPAPDSDPLQNLIRAGQHANAAARLQFLSPAMFFVGFAFRDVCVGAQIDPWMIKYFAPLWYALERRERTEYEDKYLRVRVRGVPFPGQTMCAALGCKVSMETPRKKLFPCPGNCVADRKPWYCSVQCQKKNWEDHRADCKPPVMARPLGVAPSGMLHDRTRTRETLYQQLVLRKPDTQIEIRRDDENEVDTRNGVVLQAWKTHSPHYQNQMTEFVARRYE
ncbi:hypothetical protein C8Q77DRAFT_206029 [Trametes polyzona]|nr:hypothetical protein C8Q77DRAFT_206029 [Trametes polyzona]